MIDGLLIVIFNITRFVSVRRRSSSLRDDSYHFNDTISRLPLVDYPIGDRKFTWSNKRLFTNMAKFDRFIVSSQWDTKFVVLLLRA